MQNGSIRPVDMERRFRRALHTLRTASPRLGLLELAAFADVPDEHRFLLDTYLLEVVDALPRLVDGLQLEGLDPARLAALLPAFELLPESRQEPQRQALRTLRRLIALQHAYAGDLAGVQSVLLAGALDVETDAPSPPKPYERFRRHFDRATAVASPTAADLHWMLLRWETTARLSAHTAVVPVVEQPVFSGGQRAGWPLQVSIRLFQHNEAPHDEIYMDAVRLGQDRRADPAQTPITLARRLLADAYPPLAERHYVGRIGFETHAHLHTGSSADTALTILLYGAMLHREDVRERVAMAPDALVTGGLTPEGEVTPVDPETLPLKVEAAFFSPAAVLAVPHAQQAAAARAAARLTQRYPHRHLLVLGVHTLNDVLADRRLTQRTRTALLPRAARWSWQRKTSAGGILTILLLVMVILRLLWGPLDRNPVSASAEGGLLIVRNQSGRVVAEFPIVSEEAVQQLTGKAPPTQTAFYDVDGDGRNEVFWTGRDPREPEVPRVFARSVGQGGISWAASFTQHLDYPLAPEVTENTFIPTYMTVGPHDGEDVSLYLLASHDPYFPSAVVKLDAWTGDIESHFVHSGRLNFMEAVDLDDDGITELVLGGTSQHWREAVLLVLDPRLIDGHAPSGGKYVLPTYKPGTQRSYLRFPWGPAGRVLRYLNRQVHADFVSIRPGEIEVRIGDGNLNPRSTIPSRKLVETEDSAEAARLTDSLWAAFQTTFLPEQSQIILELDHRMRVRSVGTQSAYDSLEDFLVEHGYLESRWSAADRDDYRDRVTYWNGETWVQGRPVENALYRRALSAWKDAHPAP